MNGPQCCVWGWTDYRKDTELLYLSFMYSLITSFQYLSITRNAFIACYIKNSEAKLKGNKQKQGNQKQNSIGTKSRFTKIKPTDHLKSKSVHTKQSIILKNFINRKLSDSKVDRNYQIKSKSKQIE